LQRLAVEKSRLHIPLIFMMDVIHGYGVTFPVPIATAASWDMSMIENEQRMVAKVARHAGLQWTASPMVDIARDPRWGRIIEGAGEDAFLGEKVAVAQTRGFQGTVPVDGDHMVVSLKHFAGYGYSEGGRDHDEALIPESVLRNIVLKPFKAAIDAGAGSVMSAYMDLNDVPATGNHWLLTDVLRSEWGFRGVVVSDNNAVTDLVPHGFAKDQEDAGKRALSAGVDLQMSNFGNVVGLLAAAKDNTINMQDLDRSVHRMLRLKYHLGLFDRPYIDEVAAVKFDRQPLLKEALIAAERSAVLLKNENGLLPLHANAYKKVALIGPLADSKQNTLVPWLARENVSETVTVRQALEESKRFDSVTTPMACSLAAFMDRRSTCSSKKSRRRHGLRKRQTRN
jgi:beta-glucosidase